MPNSEFRPTATESQLWRHLAAQYREAAAQQPPGLLHDDYLRKADNLERSASSVICDKSA